MRDIAREIDLARRQHGMSFDTLGLAADLSRWHASRIARAAEPDLSIVDASRLLAAVGLELSVRVYPAGDPVRDRAHLALLSKLRSILHPSVSWRTEVPLPLRGDRRAWDALISAQGWSCGIEAETRTRDLQALERRISLKARDGGVERLVLLLANTRHHRSIIRLSPGLFDAFPVPGARALELLRAGADPGGNAIVLL